MLWCTELDTAENFGLTSIQKPLIAISKCPLLNIQTVIWTKNNLYLFYRGFIDSGSVRGGFKVDIPIFSFFLTS